MKFYVLDLDNNHRDSFEECARPLDAASAHDAAAVAASEFESDHDGRPATIIVAENQQGIDARTFAVTMRVTVSYDARETR